MDRPELLSPAGDLESLKMAVRFGADAVYIGAKRFSMRSSPANFTQEELFEAVKITHEAGVKLYLACNILPRCKDIELLPAFLQTARAAGVDALIISDLGVLELAKRYAPGLAIHISTQAGVVNYAAANAFYALGAKRIVLARELSLEEIAVIRRHTPAGLEIEAFVHGAMCVSFSGRCLLSNYLAGRDANHGDCAQPCRWGYALMEWKSRGAYYPVFEDGDGTYILNAKDLCMIEYIPELIKAGITSFKIEGRAKSAYYTAAVTNAYRMAIDQYLRQPEEYRFDPRLLEELKKVSHREYCTGFYFGPIQNGQSYHQDGSLRSYDIIAVVEALTDDGLAVLRQRNPFYAGDRVEMLQPGCTGLPVTIEGIWDSSGNRMAGAPYPDMRLLVKTDKPLSACAILRKAL